MYLTDKIQRMIDNSGQVMISIVGSGGKTTLLYELFDMFSSAVSTVITTTTMMFTPELELDDFILLEGATLDSKLKALDVLKRREVRTLGLFETQMENKVKGVAPDVLKALLDRGEYPLILNEADGAKGKPLKAYGNHEPVIPQQTDLVIILAGLDGIFKPLTDEWVHRGKIFSDLTGLSMGAEVTLEALQKILTHEEGFLKAIPSGADAVVVLNKWDVIDQPLELSVFAESIFSATDKIQAVVVMALKNHQEIAVYERG